MWRKQLTGVIGFVTGVVLLVGGIVDHLFAAPKAALCDSGLGQLGQAFDTTVAHDCGLVTALESAVGWLIVVGILAVLLGIAVLVSSRRAQRLAARIPAAPPPFSAPPAPRSSALNSSAPRSPAPRSSAPQPASPPASRPWWEQS